MRQELLIKKVKDAVMFILMLVGNFLVLSGIGNLFLVENQNSFDFNVGVGSLIIGVAINYLYWFKFKIVNKVENKITEPKTTTNSQVIKANQSSILKSFWERLTWGFLPEGWRRILLLLPHTVWLIIGLAEDELDDGWSSVEFIVAAISITWVIGAGISLTISWIYDGFKKK